MRRIFRNLFSLAVALGGLAFAVAAGTALAGGDLVHPPTWHGSGCGPRYWGAQHEQGWCPDPCDSCNRWVGCNGVREMPDLLAPWQLPPDRGFQPPEHFGWASHGACEECAACGPKPHGFWRRFKFW